MEKRSGLPEAETLRSLPGDVVRGIMWRFKGRRDLQALAREARAVARGPVARLVAGGARGTHEWTAEKDGLLGEFDRAGLTTLRVAAPGDRVADLPRNLALALVAFELSWVDAGAAISAIAQHLAFAPIRERGTPEQQRVYLPEGSTDPLAPPRRGAFVLTEPIPYVGVDTGTLSGKMRVVEWPAGGEPLLQIDKRGRFITNMGFADFVAAAVESADDRIKGTCLVILEQGDPGVFDRGRPTRKLIQQLSSTCDPVFSLRVPASRIIGGYSVADGAIVPRFHHAEVIEAVFRRTRITVGLMTAAKLLSAVEPILRYQRGRFRGGEASTPGSTRYLLGLQQREDALHRLIDVWAAGEASASLGFAAARVMDEFDGLERRKQAGDTDARIGPVDALAAVLVPACKLWNTGYGATMMREAVSLMGGYGITEECPGFLGQKWMDAQLEATYEGPEAVQRRQLSVTMNDNAFLGQFGAWIHEMRQVASRRPASGACTLASAMELWLWTLRHLQRATDADGNRLYQGSRQGVTFPMADALCWILSSRYQILDVLELEAEGPHEAGAAEGLPGLVRFLSDLCHVQAARAAGEVGRLAAELVHGYLRHPGWDVEGCQACYGQDDLIALEQLIPGIESTAGAYVDVIGRDGSHAVKAGPCVQFRGIDEFMRLRAKMDGCLTGSRVAKDRAAEALTKVAIPEALDYPS